MSIQLVVFDMAGTTVLDENNVATSFQKAFALNGITIEKEMVNPLMGYHKPLAIQMVLEELNVQFDADLIEDIHTDFEGEMIEFYETDESVKPMPGAEDIFRYLKERGVRIVLNTGFSHIIAESIVSRFQWEDKGLIDDYIGSDEVEMGRPYPFMIKELMQRNGIDDPLVVAKIGDTSVDVEEGLNAGCKYVIAITTGACPEADLREKNPTHIIHHLSELPAILQ
jgi:phosphonatase-like hydrolase